MLQVYGGLLIFSGVPANIICGIVMGKDKSNHFTTRLLMVLLAAADCVVLLTALLRYWIIETFKFDIRSMNTLTCLSHTFLVAVSTDAAIATLCALSIERFVVVGFPYKSTRLVTMKNSIIFITIVYLILVFKNSFNIWSMEIQVSNITLSTANITAKSMIIKPRCLPKRRLLHYVRVFSKIDFVTYSVVPYFILFSTNMYIFIILRRQNRLFKAHLNNNSRNVNRNKKNRGRQSQNIIKILTALTVVHLVTTIPGMIYNIMTQFFPENLKYISLLKRRLISDGLMMLMFTNNATNFLAYLISSNSFRKRILILLPCSSSTEQTLNPQQTVQEMIKSPQTNYQKIGTIFENSKNSN